MTELMKMKIKKKVHETKKHFFINSRQAVPCKKKLRFALTAPLHFCAIFRLLDEVSAVPAPPNQPPHWRTHLKIFLGACLPKCLMIFRLSTILLP